MATRRELLKTTRHSKYLDSTKGKVYRTGRGKIQATTDESYAQGQERRAKARKEAGFPNRGTGRPAKRKLSDATENASKLYKAVARSQAKKRK
jgi:hypothetical protein